MDGFYPGKLLIEMKSRGADLQAAYQQALDYLPGLQDAELPAYILVSDFEHLHLYQRARWQRVARRCAIRWPSFRSK